MSGEPEPPFSQASPITVQNAISTFLVAALALTFVREDPVPRSKLWLFVVLLPIATFAVDFTWSLVATRFKKHKSERVIEHYIRCFKQRPDTLIAYDELLSSLSSLTQYYASVPVSHLGGQTTNSTALIQRIRTAGYATYHSVDPETCETIARSLSALCRCK